MDLDEIRKLRFRESDQNNYRVSRCDGRVGRRHTVTDCNKNGER